MEDTCPTCGAPVTVQVNHDQPWRSDVKSKGYTYTPPTLDAAERAVVEAVTFEALENKALQVARNVYMEHTDPDPLNKATDRVRTARMDREIATDALLAARAAATEGV